MNKDLFPETLLVNIVNRKAITTSLKIAEHFQKLHKNVVRDIEKLLVDCPDYEFSRLNFEPSDYQNDRGKTYLMYTITEKGFALLAMGFTGKQALQWKLDFLNAFENMETALKMQTERRANALGFVRPAWPVIEEATQAWLSRREICTLTGHRSPDSISANRRAMRAAGLLSVH